jgi:hypothetical protein
MFFRFLFLFPQSFQDCIAVYHPETTAVEFELPFLLFLLPSFGFALLLNFGFHAYFTLYAGSWLFTLPKILSMASPALAEISAAALVSIGVELKLIITSLAPDSTAYIGI